MEGWCPVADAGIAATTCPATYVADGRALEIYGRTAVAYLTAGLFLLEDFVRASGPYLRLAWSYSRVFLAHAHYIIGTLLKLVVLPLQLVFVHPVQWMWTVFLHFFENIVKPLLYFAICAMLVGSLGGVLIGGSFLLIQQLLPSKKPSSTTIY